MIPVIFRPAVAIWNGLSPTAQSLIKATPDYNTAMDVVAHKMANSPDTGREAFGGIGSVAIGAIVGGLIGGPLGFALGIAAGELGERIGKYIWDELTRDDLGDIKDKARNASTIPSPIVIDLDGDGIETVSIANGVLFDHADDGFAERTGWVSSDDGLLVRDINGNGTIDSGRELFGSETLLENGSKAANGFEALKEFDTNADGVIDVNDAVFGQLRIWKDVDGNGRTDAGELLTHAEAGVQSISVNYTNSSYIDAQGNAHRQVGSYTTTDGQTRAATDVWVKTDATYSVPTDWVEVPEDIALLPDAQGYGKVRDLRQAMAANDRRWSLIA